MFHTKVKAASRIGPHHEDVISVIIGSLLGNSIIKSKPREGTRIVLRLKSNIEYIQSTYDFFYSRGYCSNLEPRMYTRRFKKGEQTQEHY